MHIYRCIGIIKHTEQKTFDCKSIDSPRIYRVQWRTKVTKMMKGLRGHDL